MGGSQSGGMTEYAKKHFVKHIGRYWNKFFKHNNDKFFSNRHYIVREYVPLREAIVNNEPVTFCEIGCGCGNTINGVLASIEIYNKDYNIAENMKIYGFDVSKHAVQILKQQYSAEKNFFLFVHNLLEGNSIVEASKGIIPARHCIRFASMIFVLSAFSSLEDMKMILNTKVYELLEEGGYLFLRDYCMGDMAYHRFLETDTFTKQVNDHCFVRGDGTLAFFFTAEMMRSLFDEDKFEVIYCEEMDKLVENRGEELSMNRKFIQLLCRTKKAQ